MKPALAVAAVADLWAAEAQRGGPPGGGGPGGGAGPGGQASMISLDALEEIRVQTSTFAPEFGRSPGAQISLTSRSGANQFHGSLYEYLRNEKLNANDWFANSTGLSRSKMRNNNFGGTFSGPLRNNRTYFFGSYEGVRSLQPQTALTNVPDLSIRETVAPELQPYLNAFPIPNGRQLDDNVATIHGCSLKPLRFGLGQFTPRSHDQ